ncbi:GDP-L-fucose synthase [uncultured Alsobacter sp.]|uniref:GDP-L-fucose synthase n=1 Tax=uncultured Alsobacter sp. TaxID=1748258 RepID=UPI0025E9407C|nr:GDP-L-fucose synthase [uncultured Alsobacter sp.]
MTSPQPFSLAGRKVFVAGHRGMVGSALVRRLAGEDCEIITATRLDLDLKNQAATFAFVKDVRPDAVIIAAAKVGGILANDTYPADFLYDNLAIEANLIKACHLSSVAKVLFLGSSCIYPKLAPQPLREDALLTGPLEPTNEWYAVAKIAGIKLCQAFRRQYGCDYVSAMPTNLYGPEDNFDLQSSHVLPAMIRKAEAARRDGGPLPIWGTGKVRREFLHVDDCADALIHILKNYSAEEHVNVGCGSDVTIAELAGIVSRVVGYDGPIAFDTTKPDGTPRKLMDVSRLAALGWTARIGLEEGIASTYRWYRDHHATA